MTKACVIGWPIEHSRSPVIHNYWLKSNNIQGSYVKEAVPPEELKVRRVAVRAVDAVRLVVLEQDERDGA